MIKINTTKDGTINIESEGKWIKLVEEACGIVIALKHSLSDRDPMMGAFFKHMITNTSMLDEVSSELRKEDQEECKDERIGALMKMTFNGGDADES